ncbi:MAG TPA: hypothetical protein VKI17_10615, partial [Gemmataceae bacterium]|nr:hypothetical protein [Gemmataceae bacterium]
MSAVARTDLQSVLLRLRDTASIEKYANFAAMRDVKALSETALELAGETLELPARQDNEACADLADLSAALHE